MYTGGNMKRNGTAQQYVVNYEDGKPIPARTEWAIQIHLHGMAENEFEEFRKLAKSAFGVNV
jgi:hypothetical protein